MSNDRLSKEIVRRLDKLDKFKDENKNNVDVEIIEETDEDDEDDEEFDPDDLSAGNEQLGDVLTIFDCADLLPLANRVIWLANVKEALGYIPEWFKLTYQEIKLLVILKEENSLKMACDSYQTKREQNAQLGRARSVGMDRAIINR